MKHKMERARYVMIFEGSESKNVRNRNFQKGRKARKPASRNRNLDVLNPIEKVVNIHPN